MKTYDNTKRKIEFLIDENILNSTMLDGLNNAVLRTGKLYYNKKRTEYRILDKVLLYDFPFPQYIKLELRRFPLSLLPFIEVISYGQTLEAYREKINKSTFFAVVQHSFSITEKEIDGKKEANITMLLFFQPNFYEYVSGDYISYPAWFSLYLIVINPRYYHE